MSITSAPARLCFSGTEATTSCFLVHPVHLHKILLASQASVSQVEMELVQGRSRVPEAKSFQEIMAMFLLAHLHNASSRLVRVRWQVVLDKAKQFKGEL